MKPLPPEEFKLLGNPKLDNSGKKFTICQYKLLEQLVADLKTMQRTVGLSQKALREQAVFSFLEEAL